MQKLTFDIESTGLDTQKDRIVQLAIKVVDEQGKIVVSKKKVYNPGIAISKNASDTHGIHDKDVKNCPPFSEDAKKLKKLFEDKIIIGFNIMRFDIPMLIAEMKRCGLEINFSRKFIDVLNIEKKVNSNKLSDTYKRYTGKKLDEAHDALADVEATFTILEKQIENHDLTDDQLYELSGTKDLLDLTGKLKYDDQGFMRFNFGKCENKRVIDENDYCNWILNEPTFSKEIKDFIRGEQNKHLVKTLKKPEPVLNLNYKQINQKRYLPMESTDDIPFVDDLPF